MEAGDGGIVSGCGLDSDGEGIPDVVEWIVKKCADPIAEMNDADGDGLPNFRDVDSDGNGLGFPACEPLKP